MSKIANEIAKATGVKEKRGESRQDFLKALVVGVQGLSDPQWDALSGEAQDWFNACADAKNAKKKELPEFPDAEQEEAAEEPAPTRRRGAAAEEAAAPTGTKEITPDDVEKGMAIRVVTKRGKDVSGTVTGVDNDGFSMKVGEDTEDFDFSRIDKMYALDTGGGKAAAATDEVEDPIKVGNEVKVINARDKEYVGKIVEVDDEIIVLDVDGKDVEVARDRIKSIELVGGKKAADKPAVSGRRGAAADADKGKDAEESKPKRSSNPAGTSVGGRIRELMAEDIEITEAEISKQLKADGIEFRDTSLKMIFKDCTQLIEALKKNKKLK